MRYFKESPPPYILSGYIDPEAIYPQRTQPLLRQPVPTIKQIHASHLLTGTQKSAYCLALFVLGFSEKIRPKPSSAVYYFPLIKFPPSPASRVQRTGALRPVGISQNNLRLFVPLFGLFAFLETAFRFLLLGWLLGWLASASRLLLAGFSAGWLLFPAGFSASSASASRLASCFFLGWLASWLSCKKYRITVESYSDQKQAFSRITRKSKNKMQPFEATKRNYLHPKIKDRRKGFLYCFFAYNARSTKTRFFAFLAKPKTKNTFSLSELLSQQTRSKRLRNSESKTQKIKNSFSGWLPASSVTEKTRNKLEKLFDI